ncbi:hypothetical protein [Nocardia sp. SSK8]|uniref:hypothetical protein n=1 Tax=Nocardia sp. SSK8 TaxID=3120154 RepID=UPI00300A0D52
MRTELPFSNSRFEPLEKQRNRCDPELSTAAAAPEFPATFAFPAVHPRRYPAHNLPTGIYR